MCQANNSLLQKPIRKCAYPTPMSLLIVPRSGWECSLRRFSVYRGTRVATQCGAGQVSTRKVGAIESIEVRRNPRSHRKAVCQANEFAPTEADT
jgi:hypothetical protein